jgi:DNA-binding response OmpR family regulator/cytochrome c-type biogenesis protein CcmH/NrfG
MSKLPYEINSISVLVVDDHAHIRKAICKVLQSMEVGAVHEAADNDSAIQYLSKEMIDLVILDLRLTDQSGLAILEEVRNRDTAEDVPVLIVTGEASKDEIMRAVDQGANDYLLKPFHAEDLEKKVGQLLHAYHRPDQITRLLRSAGKLVQESRIDEAHTFIDQALEIDQENVRALHAKAVCLNLQGQSDAALKLLDRNIKTNSSYYRSYRAKADILVKMNSLPEAAEALRSELKINPKVPIRQSLLGKVLLQQGRPAEALEHFRAALVENSQLLEALMHMALTYAQLKNLDKSLYYVKRIRRYHPAESRALDLAIQLAMQFNEHKKVELLIKDERNANPKRKDAYLALTKFYDRTGDEEKTQQSAQELIAKFPDDIHAHVLLGDISFRKKEYKQAAKHYIKAVKGARSVTICQKLTRCFIELKDYKRAETSASNLFRMRVPSEALKLLAEIYFKLGEVSKAALCYQRLDSLMGNKQQIPPAATKAFELMKSRRQKLTRVAS